MSQARSDSRVGQNKGTNEANVRANNHEGQTYRTNVWLYILQIGFFAGLFWGMIREVLYLLRFTSVIPGFILEPYFKHAFLMTGWGHVAGISAFIVLSIIATLIYKLVLGKIRGPWTGLAYGLIWWAIIMFAAGPWLGMMTAPRRIGWDVLITELCFYCVWGLFIGFSIAFEFTDEASREPAKTPS
ncbi:hypothetical protein EBB07_29970 [Paenibacillaceae bacterium]|nr:hypothetical protein EBB07_29970 [Paenibacillaceae bacterium]